MSKEIDFKSRLDPDNIPTPKSKKEPAKKERLGLLNQKKLSQPIAFRMRPEIIEMFNKLVMDVNKRSKIRLPKVAVLELCIQYAKARKIDELLEFYHDKVL